MTKHRIAIAGFVLITVVSLLFWEGPAQEREYRKYAESLPENMLVISRATHEPSGTAEILFDFEKAPNRWLVETYMTNLMKVFGLELPEKILYTDEEFFGSGDAYIDGNSIHVKLPEALTEAERKRALNIAWEVELQFKYNNGKDLNFDNWTASFSEEPMAMDVYQMWQVFQWTSAQWRDIEREKFSPHIFYFFPDVFFYPRFEKSRRKWRCVIGYTQLPVNQESKMAP